jgi:hypothetical protein
LVENIGRCLTTLGGAMSALGGSSGSVSLTPDGNGGFSLSNVASAASTGRSLFSGGGLGSFFPGGGSINTGVGFLDAGLNATAFGGGAGNIASSVPGAAGDGGALLAHAGGGGATFGQLLGPAAAIGGGIYGMYSGIKKGGVGGYTGAAGGAISAATGIGMLGSAAGLLPALGVLGPVGLALGAALALAGAFMPGKKASGKGQEVSINTLNGDRTAYGLGGSRFSQGNADYAGSLAGNVAGLESALQDQLGECYRDRQHIAGRIGGGGWRFGGTAAGADRRGLGCLADAGWNYSRGPDGDDDGGGGFSSHVSRPHQSYHCGDNPGAGGQRCQHHQRTGL